MKLIACMILCIVLTGCFAENKESAPGGKPEPAEIKLTPVELFRGDEAKYEHFLGSMTGAFQLAFEGSKPYASLDIDIWENGKKVNSAGSIMDLFYMEEETSRSGEVEVILSIDTLSIDEKKELCTIKVYTIHKTGSSLNTFTIPLDKKLTARGLIQDMEQHSFTADQPVHVFGMHATSTNSIRSADFSPESLGQTEWAVLFTLRFEANNSHNM